MERELRQSCSIATAVCPVEAGGRPGKSRARRYKRASTAGTSILEFAFIVPVFLLLLFCAHRFRAAVLRRGHSSERGPASGAICHYRKSFARSPFMAFVELYKRSTM